MNRSRLSRSILVMLLVMLLAPFSRGEEGVLLRCKYKRGDRYVCTSETKHHVFRKTVHKELEVEQITTIETELEILKVYPNGTADIRITFRRIALKQQSDDTVIDYDSADNKKKEASHPSLTGMKKLIGQSLVVRRTADGEVVDISGLKEVARSIRKEFPEGGAARQNAEKLLDKEGVLGRARMAKRLSEIGFRCPENPLHEGDNWSQTQKLSIGFINVLVKTRYEVTDVTDKSVKLSVKSSVESMPESKEKMPILFVVDKGKSRVTGSMQVARGNALVFTRSSKQTLDGHCEIPGAGLTKVVINSTMQSSVKKLTTEK